MKWRVRSPWLMAPVAVLLVAAFSYGAMQSKRLDDPFNVQGLALFEALERAEAARLNEVLRVRLGLGTAGDALQATHREVQSALAALDAQADVRPNGESAQLAERRRAMRLALERENDLVERFRSTNALRAAALAQLPEAAEGIDAGAGADDATVDPAIERARLTASRLMLATVIYGQHAGGPGAENIAVLLQRFARDRTALPADRRPPFDRFLAQVDTVLREQAIVDATLGEIDALAAEQAIESARRLLSEEGQRDVVDGEFWHLYLLSFTLTTIALFVASAIYLVKSLGVIRRVNRALNDANEGLEQRVAARTRELFDANQVLDRTVSELVLATDEAQAASLAKSQFMANVSHEIRTPMNAILGMLTLLRRTELNARQADYAARTDVAARSLLVLLNDILDFSKVEAGEMALERTPFDTAGLLRDVTVIASGSVGAKPIRLLLDADPRLPARLVGDALRLQQVLVNLLGNAIKFTEAGEVVLSIAVAEQTAGSAVLEFAVRDTGIGIAAENHDRVFGRFTQAESSTTRRFGGTGLGLTISQKLVELMGGDLALESALGAGSRFHFRIELETADTRTTPAIDADDNAVRLLLVDDHRTAREVLARAARALGWHVDVAADTADLHALATQRANDGDEGLDATVVSAALALLDPVAMASMGGDGPAHSRPLRLVVGSQHDRDRLAQAGHVEGGGFDAYLVEPVTPTVLRAVIDMPSADRASSSLTMALPAPVGEKVSPPVGVVDAAAPTSRPKRLAPTRVLLVEDNAQNQQIARELLEDEGASVVIAGNGSEAIIALEASPDAFDIVLMDIQMPVMDGLTATRLIRGELALALPIVAMTANISAADRAACTAAGMNDHVGKPFDLDALVACLLRHTRRAASADGPRRVGPAVSGAVGAAAAVGGIAVDAALLRLGGNQPAYRRLLASFMEQLDKAPSQLRAAADRDDVRRRLHTLKGLSATLGATELAASVAHAEASLSAHAASAGNDVELAVARVCAAIDLARPGLAALLLAWPLPPRADAVATRARLDDAALRPGLERIARQLRQGDMDALRAMDELHDGSGPPALDALRLAIADLDFERALVLCDGLCSDLRDGSADADRIRAVAVPA